MKNRELKAIVAAFLIGFSSIVIGLHGAIGGYQLSFTTENCSNTLIWILIDLQLYLSKDYRETVIQNKKLKDQLQFMTDQYNNRARLHNEVELDFRSLERRYKNIEQQYEASNAKVKALRSTQEITLKLSGEVLEERNKLKRLNTSLIANNAKLSNDVQRANDKRDEAEKKLSVLHVQNSILQDELNSLKKQLNSELEPQKDDFMLPERWAVRITEENMDMLIKWVERQPDYDGNFIKSCKFNIGHFVVPAKTYFDNSYQHWDTELLDDQIEITTEQFKKHVLNMQ